jgi:DNA-binding response OmpR family regulator
LRLLVLDGSRVLRQVVERLVSSEVEVESADTFDEAYDVLCGRPPDAAIVTLGPSELPWRKIQRCCFEHQPPIPVLFESCVFHDAEEAGLDDLDDLGAFLTKPYHTAELKGAIDGILRIAERTRPSAPPSRDETPTL